MEAEGPGQAAASAGSAEVGNQWEPRVEYRQDQLSDMADEVRQNQEGDT